MIKFRKVLLPDEKIVYKSKTELFWYIIFSWMPFSSVCINLCICISIGIDFCPLEVVFGSIGLFFINIFFNFFDSKKYIITNNNLKILRTVFLTKIDSYPLDNIQGHSLEESFCYRGIQSYLFKIKLNNIIKTYRFYSISKKSMEVMKKIEVHKDCNPEKQMNTYYIFSPFFLINILNMLFIFYFSVLFILDQFQYIK